MQGDFWMAGEEEKWEVLEVRKVMRGTNELVVYVRTQPKNWTGPELSDKPAWEE